MTATRRRLAAVVVVSLLGLGACGSDDEDEASPGTTADASGAVDAQASDEDAQALVFAECMRSNGIAMPDPGSGQQAFIDAFHSQPQPGRADHEPTPAGMRASSAARAG